MIFFYLVLIIAIILILVLTLYVFYNHQDRKLDNNEIKIKKEHYEKLGLKSESKKIQKFDDF